MLAPPCGPFSRCRADHTLSGSVERILSSSDCASEIDVLVQLSSFCSLLESSQQHMTPHRDRKPPLSAGADCAGIIAHLPPFAVPGRRQVLCAGDAVFGLARGSLGSHVTANTTALTRMPPAVEPDQASAAPTVFITAELALRDAVQTPRSARCA